MTNELPGAHRGCVLSELPRRFVSAAGPQICRERFRGASRCHCSIVYEVESASVQIERTEY